jgi:hypothetical protein
MDILQPFRAQDFSKFMGFITRVAPFATIIRAAVVEGILCALDSCLKIFVGDGGTQIEKASDSLHGIIIPLESPKVYSSYQNLEQAWCCDLQAEFLLDLNTPPSFAHFTW